MATYYLFDMHVPSLANSRLVDVVTTTPSNLEFRVDGLTPVKVPEGVRVVNPTSLTDLLSQKYAGILAMYPGFGSIVYDDLLDGTGLSPNPGGRNAMTGGRGAAGGGVITSVADPNADVSPTVVSQCILVTEVYTWRYVDPRDGRIERYYVEEPEATSPHNVSVNGGSSFVTTTSGEVASFVVGTQGSIVQIAFFNSGESINDRVRRIGSWAVIY